MRASSIGLFLVALLFGVGHPGVAPADTHSKESAREETASSSAEKAASEQRGAELEVIAYVPPPRGAPGRRIGGGTRGTGTNACAAELEALAPADHAGLTSRAQPALQFFVSENTTCRVDFTLNDPRQSEPLVERTLPGPFEAGIHAIRLSELGVELDTGVAYEWWIALVRDPERRSRDTVAGASVLRTTPPVASAPAPDPATASALSVATRAARGGLWYDALASLEGDDPEVARARAALLDQVGLSRVTEGEPAPGD